MQAMDKATTEHDAHRDAEAVELGESSEAPFQQKSNSSQLSRQKSSSKIPRPSSCAVATIVLCFLAFVGVVTYLSVWDREATFRTWVDRWFASEKKLSEESGKTELVRYNAGNWIYFVLLCIIFIVNIAIIVPGVTVVLRRRCRSVKKKVERARNLEPKPSIEAILPAYLPNEKNLLEETIRHILKNVESPGDFKLYVVYNTKGKDDPEVEQRLQAMSEEEWPKGRKLTVLKAEDSESKAQNINLVLPRLSADLTVVYDADHHPDPDSLMLLVEKLLRRDVACVQGSTYIRDLNSGLLARAVDAEFFVTHFVYFPIMRLLTRNAVFGGSNGLWKTTVLQGIKASAQGTFDRSMLTEDIDVSTRALLEKHSFEFCPEARSGELAPINCQALLKQRLRWAIGWDQVSLKLSRKLIKSDAENTRKTAVAYICWSRWFMQIVGLVAGIATPVLTFLPRFDPNLCHCGTATQLLQTCMFYFYITLVISCILEAIFQTHHRGSQSWIQVIFVALFMIGGFFYIIFQAALIMGSLYKIGTGRDGEWVVTKRRPQKCSNCPEVLESTEKPMEEVENGSSKPAAGSEQKQVGKSDSEELII